MDAKQLFEELSFTPLVLVPEEDSPTPHPPASNVEEIRARAASAELLMKHGLDVTPITEEQREESRAIFEGTKEQTAVAAMEPEVVLHLRELLNEYDYQVVREAQQLRNYVTNRLILETTDKNATIRLRALENLGKISDVGLFSEKSEVIHSVLPASELQSQLRSRLENIIRKADVEVVDVAPKVIAQMDESGAKP